MRTNLIKGIRSRVLAICTLLLLVTNAQKTFAQSVYDAKSAEAVAAGHWKKLPDWVAKVKLPAVSKNREVHLGPALLATDAKTVIQKHLDELSSNGGGKLIIDSGHYTINGPLHLRSNTHLHLSRGTFIHFGTHPLYYTPLVKTSWEGIICYNYSPLVYAYKATHVALTSDGAILDGQASGNWSSFRTGLRGRNQLDDMVKLRNMGKEGKPEQERIFGHGFLDLNGDQLDDGHGDGQQHLLRPHFIQFYQCQQVLIEGLTLQNSPFWNVHIVSSNNVQIKGLNIQAGTSDDLGVVVESSQLVEVSNCQIRTVEAPLSVKAGRDKDGQRQQVCKMVYMHDCEVSAMDRAAIWIGTEVSAGIAQVFIERVKADTAASLVGIQTNGDRGGSVEQVFIRNCELSGSGDEAISIRMDASGYTGGKQATRIQDIYLQDLQVNATRYEPVIIKGDQLRMPDKIWIDRVKIDRFLGDATIEKVKRIGGTVTLAGKTQPLSKGK